MDEVYAGLLVDLPSPSREAMDLVRRRSKEVLRPIGALDRLDDIAVWLAGWQGTSTPSVAAPAALISSPITVWRQGGWCLPGHP